MSLSEVIQIVIELAREYRRELINLAVEVIPLAVIARYLHSAKAKLSDTVENLGTKIETLKQISMATQQIAEVALGPPSGSSSAEHWENVRTVWQRTRNRIELAVGTIKRKNSREKYSRFTRYRYSPIVRALYKDKVLDERICLLLQAMELRFLNLRRQPKDTTSADVEQFNSWEKDLGKSLPKDETTDPSSQNQEQ